MARWGQQVIATGVPILLNFDTRLRYGCNGSIDIFVEKLRPTFLDEVAKTLRARRECLVTTAFANSDSLGSRVLETEIASNEGVFLQSLRPPLQLLLVGEGPDSEPLRRFAAILGWPMIETEDAATLPNEFDEWTAAIVKNSHWIA